MGERIQRWPECKEWVGGTEAGKWAAVDPTGPPCCDPTGSCVCCCSTSNTCMGSEWRCAGLTTSLPRSPTWLCPTTRVPSTCLVRPHGAQSSSRAFWPLPHLLFPPLGCHLSSGLLPLGWVCPWQVHIPVPSSVSQAFPIPLFSVCGWCPGGWQCPTMLLVPDPPHPPPLPRNDGGPARSLCAHCQA